MFALGQKQSSGIENGLLFVAGSALVAFILAITTSPLFGAFSLESMVRDNWKSLLFSGAGLFLTYVGFNLLYAKFGASQYVLYATISIITTTVFVGIILLKEPVNIYHVSAILLAMASVILFSVGQSKI